MQSFIAIKKEKKYYYKLITFIKQNKKNYFELLLILTDDLHVCQCMKINKTITLMHIKRNSPPQKKKKNSSKQQRKFN